MVRLFSRFRPSLRGLCAGSDDRGTATRSRRRPDDPRKDEHDGRPRGRRSFRRFLGRRSEPAGSSTGSGAGSGPLSLLNVRSAAGQVFVLQVVLVVLLVAVALTALVVQASR